MKYFSTFSGIGGFELGIKQAYEDYNKQVSSVKQNKKRRNRKTDERQNLLCDRQLSPLCVGYSEIDKYAIQVYNKHFNHKNYGNIAEINTSKLPNFDLLVGGFPCQAFSIAGKRKGFDDTRGTLFFDLARILRNKRPRYFVFENVKGLLSHDSGKTFQTILRILSDLGYFVEWQVLNSKNFGVPQNRERVFIAGYLREKGGQKVFPIGEDDKKDTRNTGEDLSYCLDSNYHKGINTLEKGRRQLIIKNPLRGKTKFGWHFEQNVFDKDGISRAVKASEGSGNRLKILDAKIRRLTPIECERLQGFPDDWTKIGTTIDTAQEPTGYDCFKDIEISDTQRYKMCGNAVSVPVIQAIVKKMIL